MIGVDEVADGLYGLPLDQFIVARNEAAKAMAASGDRNSATLVRKLPKPSMAAWLGNVLARRHSRAIDELVKLGTEFRQAQERGEGGEIRRLSTRRQELVIALLALADDEAKSAGLPPGAQARQQLAGTLDAVVADESAASEFRGGRLIAPLSHVGFGPVAAQGRGSKVPSPRGQQRPEKITGDRDPTDASGATPAARGSATEADRALVKARTALLSSDGALDKARRRHEVAAIRRREAAEALRDAERELAVASAALVTVTQRRRRDERNVKVAERERQIRTKKTSKK